MGAAAVLRKIMAVARPEALLSRAEVLTRYRNLREISKRHHSAVLNFPGQGCDHFPGSAHRPGSGQNASPRKN